MRDHARSSSRPSCARPSSSPNNLPELRRRTSSRRSTRTSSSASSTRTTTSRGKLTEYADDAIAAIGQTAGALVERRRRPDQLDLHARHDPRAEHLHGRARQRLGRGGARHAAAAARRGRRGARSTGWPAPSAATSAARSLQAIGGRHHELRHAHDPRRAGRVAAGGDHGAARPRPARRRDDRRGDRRRRHGVRRLPDATRSSGRCSRSPTSSSRTTSCSRGSRAGRSSSTRSSWSSRRSSAARCSGSSARCWRSRPPR